MSARPISRFQKIVIVIFWISVLTPLPIALIGGEIVKALHLEIGEPGLAGVTANTEVFPLTIQNWVQHKFQQSATDWVNQNFSGRSYLVRGYNELVLRFLGKREMNNGQVVVGHQNNLFDLTHLQYFSRLRGEVSDDYLESVTILMRHLQNLLERQKVKFFFLTTPSKVSLYRDEVPNFYLEKIQRYSGGEPSTYQRLLQRIREYQINFVDGRVTSLENYQSLPVRAFARTGHHWIKPLAAFTAQDLVNQIYATRGGHPPKITETNASIDGNPEGAYDDLFRVLNVVAKPKDRYLHADFRITNGQPERQGSITFVGSSFVRELVDVLDSARVFANINYYYYFRINVQRLPADTLQGVNEAAIPWEKDFLGVNTVVLEMNETMADGKHVADFLTTAILNLEKDSGTFGVRDGVGILHLVPRSAGGESAITGNIIARNGKTQVDGDSASIVVPLDSKEDDLKLWVQAKPILGKAVKRCTVEVSADGTRIAAWQMKDPDFAFYVADIPASILTGRDALTLRFRVDSGPGTVGVRKPAQSLELKNVFVLAPHSGNESLSALDYHR